MKKASAKGSFYNRFNIDLETFILPEAYPESINHPSLNVLRKKPDSFFQKISKSGFLK